MTTPSDAPGLRFRRADVTESTPEDRVRELVEDGVRMYAVYEDQLRIAAEAGDHELVLRLAGVATTCSDRHRAYAAVRLAGSLLVRMSQVAERDDAWRWTAPLDAAVRLLVPALDMSPHEPELLDQLGVVAFELGDVTLARRLFEAVRELEPEHELARGHLRACAAVKRGDLVRDAAPERAAPSLAAQRTTIRSIVERAVRLADRSITLCMIVRDEHDMLPGCLEAVAPFVDQIVVVDTGSVDDTREIARSFGAEVVECRLHTG